MQVESILPPKGRQHKLSIRILYDGDYCCFLNRSGNAIISVAGRLHSARLFAQLIKGTPCAGLSCAQAATPIDDATHALHKIIVLNLFTFASIH